MKNHMELNFNHLLKGITFNLMDFLKKVLPSLYDDWWKQAVLNCLSSQQQFHIRQRNLNTLESLDLYALLRIFDQNWYHISNKHNLPPEARHFVKEMQTIRNRWAHESTEGISIDDEYRDLDTLQRFAVTIGADETFIQEVSSWKTSLLSILTGSKTKFNENVTKTSQITDVRKAEFEPGQLVFVKSNPSLRGAVLAVITGVPENRFKVFIGSETQTFYGSQLEAESIQEDKYESISCELFHAYLTSLQIRYPGLSTLYSLNAARIDFIPYQFRPVIKFIRSDRPRLLIADGVGVGKTIEAGLILRELQARREIQSVLIICPRPLITERKWLNEMKRFEERFTHIDGRTLRYCINEADLEGNWPEQNKKIIIPYSLFDETLLYGSGPGGKRKRKKGLLDLDPPPRFDLVIVDEAHHIRNMDTFSHKAVRFFCDHAEAVVFLTATPIQLGNNDLFVLLNTLRPDLIIDHESYIHMAEPNQFINQAISLARVQEPGWTVLMDKALEQAATTAWGQAILSYNPIFLQIRSRLSEGNITNEERVQMITDMELMHTFSGIINRTRRRDIGIFTIRKPETIQVSFTPSQQHLHDEVLKIQAEIYKLLHGDVNVTFLMTTIRRQAASCIYGLVPFLENILKRHIDELSWEEADDTGQVPHDEFIEAIKSQIQSILESAKSLDPFDPKLEALRNFIRDKQQMQNNKIMLFSSFRHTLYYLFKHLRNDGFRVGLVHGDTPDEERNILRNRFEKPRDIIDSLDVLLFSEIGCEGLDYQFCDCIVNYDLPWNPMRIEQRIGRIDRNGQKSETVAIINLITPGTVDADIYERCLVRIGVFNSALGGSEEILGEITREIRNIAENYSLNDEERKEKLQQLADNKIRLIQEQEELEKNQMELFGIRLPEDQIKKEIDDASSYWLSPISIRRLVSLYLQRKCGKDQEYILGEKPLKTLRLSQDFRNILLQDFYLLPRQNSIIYREWEAWLKGGNPYLPITFDPESASHNPDSAFIIPVHPLVIQAAMSFDSGKRVITKVEAKSSDVPAGKYDFAIYEWRFYGIREDLILIPIASSEIITKHLGSLLEKSVDVKIDFPEDTDSSVWNHLDAKHYHLWSEVREKHQKRTQELAEFRRESLKTSHRARIALLEEQLREASNEKIQRMRYSQIASADSDYARHIQELDIAMERADVIAEPVAYGVILIMEGNNHVL